MSRLSPQLHPPTFTTPFSATDPRQVFLQFHIHTLLPFVLYLSFSLPCFHYAAMSFGLRRLRLRLPPLAGASTEEDPSPVTPELWAVQPMGCPASLRISRNPLCYVPRSLDYALLVHAKLRARPTASVSVTSYFAGYGCSYVVTYHLFPLFYRVVDASRLS